jgi:hypothetical protein
MGKYRDKRGVERSDTPRSIRPTSFSARHRGAMPARASSSSRSRCVHSPHGMGILIRFESLRHGARGGLSRWHRSAMRAYAARFAPIHTRGVASLNPSLPAEMAPPSLRYIGVPFLCHTLADGWAVVTCILRRLFKLFGGKSSFARALTQKSCDIWGLHPLTTGAGFS